MNARERMVVWRLIELVEVLAHDQWKDTSSWKEIKDARELIGDTRDLDFARRRDEYAKRASALLRELELEEDEDGDLSDVKRHAPPIDPSELVEIHEGGSIDSALAEINPERLAERKHSPSCPRAEDEDLP